MAGLIRPAEMRDLAALTRIYNAAIAARCNAYLEPLTEAERRPWLAAASHPDTPVFVWEEDGQAAGFCNLSGYRSGRGALSGVVEISYYVEDHFRRRGIARRLVEHALEHARAQGRTEALAILLGGNSPSIALLEALGFETWGRLPAVARFPGGDVRDHLYYGLKL